MGKAGQMVKKPATERIADSWRNLMLRAGIGAGSADDGGHYAVNYTSRDRPQLDAAFRSNWMAMKMVSLPAIDMTREGVELGGALTPDQISALNKCMQRRAIWKLLRDAIKWGRGSSPLARGTGDYVCPPPGAGRFIPAGAGNS